MTEAADALFNFRDVVVGKAEAQTVAEAADAGAAATGQKPDFGAGRGLQEGGRVDLSAADSICRTLGGGQILLGAGEPEEEAAAGHAPGRAVADMLAQRRVHCLDSLLIGAAQTVQIVPLPVPLERDPHQI